jgi:hypothetical protein
MQESSEILSTELPQTFERRAFIRYARRLDMLWQLLGVARKDLTSAEIFDLSVTGVGIRLDRDLPVGRVLVIRMPTTTHGWTSHLVRIRHCERLDTGRFQMGCAFVKPLTIVQLQALLR